MSRTAAVALSLALAAGCADRRKDEPAAEARPEARTAARTEPRERPQPPQLPARPETRPEVKRPAERPRAGEKAGTAQPEGPPIELPVAAVYHAHENNRFKYEADYQGRLAVMEFAYVMRAERIGGKPALWVSDIRNQGKDGFGGTVRLNVDEATARLFAREHTARYEAVGRIDGVDLWNGFDPTVVLRDVRVRKIGPDEPPPKPERPE